MNTQDYFEGKNADKFIAKEVRRFWSKVDKTGANGCWLWTGSKTHRGYGTVRINGEQIVASRFSFVLNVKPIPLGKQVCHKCDNPPCVNPEHLFLGSPSQNTLDMMKKGRHPSSLKYRRELPETNKPVETQITKPTNGKFSDTLRDWRLRKNLSQREASQTLGINIDTLQNWEQDRTSPTGVLKTMLTKQLK